MAKISEITISLSNDQYKAAMRKARKLNMNFSCYARMKLCCFKRSKWIRRELVRDMVVRCRSYLKEIKREIPNISDGLGKKLGYVEEAVNLYYNFEAPTTQGREIKKGKVRIERELEKSLEHKANAKEVSMTKYCTELFLKEMDDSRIYKELLTEPMLKLIHEVNDLEIRSGVRAEQIREAILTVWEEM